MYSYLSVYNRKLICINGNEVFTYDESLKKIIHSKRITYVSEDLVVDEEKRLFKLCDNMEFIVKLKKSVSKIIKKKSLAYIADRFGDVIKVDLDSKGIFFIMGNMCYNTSMCFYKEYIVTSDKYGRIRISNSKGEIFTYIFNGQEPVLCVLDSKGLVACLKNKIKLFDENFNLFDEIYFENENLRKIIMINDDKFLALGNKTIILQKDKLTEIGKRYDDAVDFSGKLAFISEKGLWIDSDFICSLENDYDDLLHKINVS